MKLLLTLVLTLLLETPMLQAKEGELQAAADCNSLLSADRAEHDVIYSPDGLRIIGFGKKFQEKLAGERTKIKKAYENMNRMFLMSDNIIFGEIAAQIAAYNTILRGGPGGAKTAIVHTLNKNIWYKVISEQTTPMQILGGQTLAAAERGVEEINLEKSIVRAPFANFDEIDKAQPQLMTELFPLLNAGERRISVGGKSIQAATRSVQFTSNLSAYKMLERFRLSGMEGSGAAFLNRIHFKFLVPNWFEDHIMDEYIKMKTEQERLKSLAKVSLKAQAALKALEIPQDIDWEFLEFAATHMFEGSSDFDLILRTTVMRKAEDTRKKIKETESEKRSNNTAQAYAPSAEDTARLVGEIPKSIKATALLDLLLTDLNDKQFAARVAKPIVMSPLSVWRTFWMETEIGPGRTQFDPKTNTMNFSLVPNSAGKLEPLKPDFLISIARDEADTADAKYYYDGQSIWNDAFTGSLKELIGNRKRIALLIPDEESDEIETVDFEYLVYRHRR